MGYHIEQVNYLYNKQKDVEVTMSKCPICLNISQDDVKLCPVCNWDLSIYSLSPEGLREEQESKIYWSVEVWKELKLLRQERELIASEYALKEQWIDRLLKVFRDLAVEIEDECSKKIDSLNDESFQKLNRLNIEKKTLQNELIELKRIEKDRSTKLKQVEETYEAIIDNPNYNYSTRKYSELSSVSVKLPEIVGKAIESHTEADKDGRDKDSRAYWLKKVITCAAIKEGWINYIKILK